MVSVEGTRARLRELDSEIIKLASERTQIARDLAESKAAAGRPTVDYEQEAKVLERAREKGRAYGLEDSVAEGLAGVLIDAAVTAQEDERIRLHGSGQGKTAVVVGGAGRMGRWLDAFLAAQGHDVYILDPAVDSIEAEARLLDADLVVLAAPPGAIAKIYEDWQAGPPRGIICDVASIKTPVLEAIKALQQAGGRVASIHPLFGPGQRVLRGVDLVACDTGDQDATDYVTELFRPTAARIVHVPLADHDGIMADVLGLAHATALAFAASLPAEPRHVRSQTLGQLSDVAWSVVKESPEVYFEIQARNPHARSALARLGQAVKDIEHAVDNQDAVGFAALMSSGHDRLGKQREDL